MAQSDLDTVRNYLKTFPWYGMQPVAEATGVSVTVLQNMRGHTRSQNPQLGTINAVLDYIDKQEQRSA